MPIGIAEAIFGLMTFAVFVFLLVISITFESVIGTKGRRSGARPGDTRPEHGRPARSTDRPGRASRPERGTATADRTAEPARR